MIQEQHYERKLNYFQDRTLRCATRMIGSPGFDGKQILECKQGRGASAGKLEKGINMQAVFTICTKTKGFIIFHPKVDFIAV